LFLPVEANAGRNNFVVNILNLTTCVGQALSSWDMWVYFSLQTSICDENKYIGFGAPHKMQAQSTCVGMVC